LQASVGPRAQVQVQVQAALLPELRTEARLLAAAAGLPLALAPESVAIQRLAEWAARRCRSAARREPARPAQAAEV
jgi:hypothetical protein